MFFCGDTHGYRHKVLRNGKTLGFKALFDWNNQVTGQTMIHVGDFGYGDTYRGAQKLGRRLKARDNRMLVIRGNHDNPSWFDGRELGNLKLCPDWSTEIVDDKNVLLIGGGVSIDRSARTEDPQENGRYYWGEEMPIREDYKQIYGVDIVVTHVGPRDVTPFLPPAVSAKVLNYAAKDPRLISDLMVEEQKLEAIREGLFANNPVTHWVFGHWHHPISTRLGDCTFRGLDMCEIFELMV